MQPKTKRAKTPKRGVSDSGVDLLRTNMTCGDPARGVATTDPFDRAHAVYSEKRNRGEPSARWLEWHGEVGPFKSLPEWKRKQLLQTWQSERYLRPAAGTTRDGRVVVHSLPAAPRRYPPALMVGPAGQEIAAETAIERAADRAAWLADQLGWSSRSQLGHFTSQVDARYSRGPGELRLMLRGC